jgi:hypothetical protein
MIQGRERCPKREGLRAKITGGNEGRREGERETSRFVGEQNLIKER